MRGGRLIAVLSEKLSARRALPKTRGTKKRVPPTAPGPIPAAAAARAREAGAAAPETVTDQAAPAASPCSADAEPARGASAAVRAAVASPAVASPAVASPREPATGGPQPPAPAGLDGVSEWSILDMYNTIAHEDEQLRTANARKAEQDAFAASLGEMSTQRASAERAEKEEMEAYLAEQAQAVQAWRSMERSALERRRSVAMEERAARDDQVRELNARRQANLDRKRAEEMEDIRRCREAIQVEKDAQARKRAEEHERLLGILRDNQVENERRAKVAAQEAAEDARLMEEYTRKLEREEEARNRAFQQRMARYEAYGRMWADEGAGRKQREEEVRQERIILREAKKKEEADVERERRDLDHRRASAMRIAASNKELMKEKSLRHQADAAFRGEGEAFLAAERERALERRQRGKAHAELLEEQIATDRQRRQAVDMSAAERSVNREILNKVQSDPVMAQRIIDRLTCAHPAGHKPSSIFT